MSIRGFHHLAIQVHALEPVAAFYRDVLGLAELTRHHRPDGSLRSIWIGLPDGFLALEQADGALEQRPFRHSRLGLHLVALRIDAGARAEWLARFAKHGVPIEHETRWTVYARDPEGNRIALSHHPDG